LHGLKICTAKEIVKSTFMVKRGQGIEPDNNPETGPMEPVDLMRDAQDDLIMAIEDISTGMKTGCCRL